MQAQRLFEQVDAFLGKKEDGKLKALLLNQDAPDLAYLIDQLDHGKRKTFVLLPPEVQADVLVRLSEHSKEIIFPRLSDHTVARVLHFMNEDDATDIIQRLPEKRQTQILSYMQDDRRKRIEKLLTFGAETAGGLMDLNFIEITPETPISAVITAVQDYAKRNKQVPVVLLHTSEGTQWAPARALVSAGKHAEVGQVSRPIPAILHTADREAALELMTREHSDVICVTDDHRKTLGIIHLNDLLRIAEAEASEDVYRMGAVAPIKTSYLESGFATIWRKRVGWLSVLFVAELFTFTALSKFEASIAAVTSLALFVPLCISTGGNSGSQAATLITRALALGDVTMRDWWRVLRRELLMGLALGVTLGVVGFMRAAVTPQHILGGTDRLTMGLVIGQSVAAICLWGTLVGSMLPMLFKKLGFDPAYASSPFVATFVDVTGIVIYFSIANAFILS